MQPPIRRTPRHSAIATAGYLFILLFALAGGIGEAQSLTVLPVNIKFVNGDKATTLTVINQGDTPTSIQIRAYAWSQADGTDQLSASDLILVSPPIATLAPHAKQIVRIVLRRSPEREEDTYRILLDQIPPPAEPGIVHVVLRMSIPIFAIPKGPALPRLQFHIERVATQMYLVASNNGIFHESFHALDLAIDGGLKLNTTLSGLQYVLAGAERRWPIAAEDAAVLQHEHGTVRLNAVGPAGAISQLVPVDQVP